MNGLFLRKVTAGLCFLASLSACQDNTLQSQSRQNTINGDAIVENSELSSEEKAKQLVAAGEELFTPEAFHLSQPVFQKALQLDPENKKAELYVEVLKPLMGLKGIVKRIEPLAKNDPSNYPNFQFDLSELQKSAIPTKRFLTDNKGLSDIRSESEAQAFIDSQSEKLNALRTYLSNNKDMDVTLQLSTHWRKERIDNNRDYSCLYEQHSELTTSVNCNYEPEFMQVRFNRGEVETMKASASGLQIYHILLGAYDATGIQKALKTLKEMPYIQRTDKAITEVITANNQTATLRDQNQLKQIIDLGLDGVAGTRWAKANQDTLCPQDKENMPFVFHRSHFIFDPNSQQFHPSKVLLRRSGHLLDEGICTDKFYSGKTPLAKVLDTVEASLKGGTLAVSAAHKSQPAAQVDAEVRPSVLLSSPIQDLRQIGPKSFNDCERISQIVDPTVGGAFVSGDANDFLNQVGWLNQRAGECVL